MAPLRAHHKCRALALASAALLVSSIAAAPDAAHALSIELKDVAADRVDRQRSWAEGALPLPGTPNVAILDERMKEKGVALSAPMVIRVFKMESELEIWKAKGVTFELFATYPICHWSGSLGPKLQEGDKQAPEGFYTVTRKQLNHVGRWPRSLHLNFPNIYDQAQARTGNFILIHGGCTSVGCFAMTNPVMEEIHRLTTASIEGGQEHVPVHVFPFRMTDENMKAHPSQSWSGFWSNLKEGYDAFEKTKRPPRIGVCDGHYTFAEAAGPAASGPLEDCGNTLANIRAQDQWLDGLTAAQPVRTAAATPATLGAGLAGAGASLSDAGPASQPEPAEEADTLAVPAAVTTTITGPEKPAPPVFRCRFAHKACRTTATLEGVQTARRAAQLALGLRRLMLAGEAHARSESGTQSR